MEKYPAPAAETDITPAASELEALCAAVHPAVVRATFLDKFHISI